jgi:hypothetical protein
MKALISRAWRACLTAAFALAVWFSPGLALASTTGNLVSGAGVGWTLISSQTASNSATLSWTSIPATYTDLMLIVTAGLCVTTSDNIRIGWSIDGGTTWGTFTSMGSSASAQYGGIQMIGARTSGTGIGGTAFIQGGLSTNSSGLSVASTNVSNQFTMGTNKPINGAQVVCSTGNISSGAFALYGR